MTDNRYLDNFYTLQEACEVIGCSRAKLLQLIKDYQLSNITLKAGEQNKVMVLKEDVTKFIMNIKNTLKKG